MAQQFSTNLGLDVLPASKDPNNSYDIHRLYNAVKNLAEALDRYTGVFVPTDSYSPTGLNIGAYAYLMLQNQARVFKLANVAIGAGQFVSINAADSNLIAGVVGSVVGWAPAAIAAGNYGEIKLFGLCTNYGSLTPGAVYYAAAGGGISTTVSAQRIGIALDATNLFVNP